MKILFLAPIPPPINGHSLASEVFLNSVRQNNCVNVINLSKKKRSGLFSDLFRSIEVFKFVFEIIKYTKNVDLIYFTVSESVKGNLKDLFFLLFMYKKLSKVVLHLHGGAGMKLILNNKKSFLFLLNLFFLKKINKIIVLGESLKSIYKDTVPDNRIFIVQNFALDNCYLNLDEIYLKYKSINVLNCLFLSNLIPGKGFMELIEAYKRLTPEIQEKISINIAGAVPDRETKMLLKSLQQIYPKFKYHGIVEGEVKKDLLKKSQLFLLPTYYAYEGQPISILEAYASGSTVATTYHSGIPDIFSANVNGYLLYEKNIDSIIHVLNNALQDLLSGNLLKFGLTNYKFADSNFRVSHFLNRMNETLNSKNDINE
jgi:glycosyltransferase involved in cell wall biosynthesis